MAPSTGLRAFLAAFFMAATLLVIPRDARAEDTDDAGDAGDEAGDDASSAAIPPSRWTSIRVHGDAGTSVWIVVGASGTCEDVVSGAWQPEPDGGVPEGFDLTAAKAIAVDTDPEALTATLAKWGLPLTDDLATTIDVDAAATRGDCFVVVRENGENGDNGDGGGGGGGSPAAAAVEGCGSAAGSGGDDCGSDTGSDDDGGGCSGGDDGGGDDCSGGGDPDCRLAHVGGRQGHAHRSPTSRLLLALVGIALLARRQGSRARTSA